MTTIGRLERVPLRTVWPHEAHDFSAWLAENTDILAEHIGSELFNTQREIAAGSFSVDLLAEVESGNAVVIENQLERSDHDHLGKLITYLTAFEAKTAIWIVADPREEHTTAVAWLNQSSPASFFLFKLEAVRIADSPPAPILTKIVGPTVEGRAVGERKIERKEQHEFFQRFWSGLIDKCKTRTPSHADAKPGRSAWLWGPAGPDDVSYIYNVAPDGAQLELAIATMDRDRNQRMFDQIKESKDEIERTLNARLEWDDAKQRKRIMIRWIIETEGLGFDDVDRHDELQEIMIAAMQRFQHALQPYLDRLEL